MRGDIKGILIHLEKQNGWIAKQDRRLTELETKNAERKGEIKVLSIMWGGISAVIVALLDHILVKNI